MRSELMKQRGSMLKQVEKMLRNKAKAKDKGKTDYWLKDYKATLSKLDEIEEKIEALDRGELEHNPSGPDDYLSPTP